MSAASYLQMTDLVNFCKEYIRSSLEICNKEKEKKREKDNQAQDRTAGPDSGTAAATISSGAEAAEPHSQVAEAERGSGLHSESQTSARTALPIPVTSTPCKSRNTDSDYHSKKEFGSGGGDQEHQVDQTNHTSSPGLTPELVNPKIEYDPDEELIQSPDTKDLALYPAPALNNSIHSRLLPSSPSSSYERFSLGYSPSFNNARQLMEIVSRSEGPSLLVDRLGNRFNHGLMNSTGGRMDESGGFVGSSMLEIQSDWLGEDAGS